MFLTVTIHTRRKEVQRAEPTSIPPDKPIDPRLQVPDADADGTGMVGMARGRRQGEACPSSFCNAPTPPRQQPGESQHAAALGVGTDFRRGGGDTHAASATDAKLI